MMAGRRVTIGVLFLLTAVASAQAQAFRVAKRFALFGSSESAFPVQAAVADFGSPSGPVDGIPDVVAVMQNQTASLLYGLGNDAFLSTGRNTDLNDIPTAMAVGDFDADSVQDMVVTGTSKTLQWFRGSGEQLVPFNREGDPLPLAGSPIGLAVGQLNQDENLDVLVLHDDGSGGTVQILLGNGDGTFSPFGEPIAAGAGVSAIAVAELTGDSHADAAITSAVTNSVRILANNGVGLLQPPGTVFSVGLEPVGIAIADLNHDDRADIVTANRSSDSVSVLLATVAGGFESARDFASGGAGSFASGVGVGDFDSDGNADLLVANNRSSDVGMLFGNGIGDFDGLAAFVTDQEPVGMIVADFNGDGRDEAASLNFGASAPSVAVLARRADSKVVAIENIVLPPNPAVIVSADVNSDGLCDLLMAHRSLELGGSGFVEVYQSPAGSGAPQAVQRLPITDPDGLAHGDVNGDGLVDVVALNTAPPQLVLFTARRQGGFDTARTFPTDTDASALVLGDWNGDGRDDVAVAVLVPPTTLNGEATGAVEIRLAAASGFGAVTRIDVLAQATDLASGDFNGDGHLDLVVASSSSAGSAVLVGSGAGTFSAAGPAIPGTNGAQAVAVADYDGDGFDDLALLSATSDRKVVVSFGDGTGVFPTRRDAGTLDGPSGLVSRDVSGDGIADLIVADQASSNSVDVLRSLGSARRFSPTSFGVSRQPVDVAAGDFDGDGRYDVAALTTFVATAGILSSDIAAAVRRGDGNGDGGVSAADSTALLREVAEGGVRRVEDIARGSFQASAGVDANGDGNTDRLDVLALAHRLFN